jgi:hypothetical protein
VTQFFALFFQLLTQVLLPVLWTRILLVKLRVCIRNKQTYLCCYNLDYFGSTTSCLSILIRNYSLPQIPVQILRHKFSHNDLKFAPEYRPRAASFNKHLQVNKTTEISQYRQEWSKQAVRGAPDPARTLDFALASNAASTRSCAASAIVFYSIRGVDR